MLSTRSCIFHVLLIVPIVGLVCCTPRKAADKGKIVVTISPIRYVVEKIVGGDFEITTLVPPSASPESYEPTPAQMVDVSESDFLFATGLLDFEKQLVAKLEGSGTKAVELHEGMTLLEGTCGHSHHGHAHNHGADPHIWTSPRLLVKMAGTVYDAINKRFPDSVKYRDNYLDLVSSFEELDRRIRSRVDSSAVKYFVIYHPALTYYAKDYGLTQVSLENEGKEPSAIRIREVMDIMKGQDISKILYQKQFSRSVVEAVANETGASTVAVDPLDENVVDNLLYITNIITSK